MFALPTPCRLSFSTSTSWPRSTAWASVNPTEETSGELYVTLGMPVYSISGTVSPAIRSATA
jgi:hypothetical protein